MTVKTVSLPTLSALSGMYAFVYTTGGVLVNTGGDVLTAVSGAAAGKFQFDVAESLTDDYYEVRIYESSTVDPDGLLYYGSLVEGDNQVRDSWPPAALPTEGGGNTNDRSLIVYTTIATLTSQTVFTITAGPSNDDALNDSVAVLTSQDGTKASRVPVLDYAGSTKQVTLSAAPKFTLAVGDFVAVIASGSTSSGSSDNTKVLEAIAEVQTDVSSLLGLHGSSNPLPDGYVSALTEPLVIGDDYTDAVGRLIRIDLLDSAGDPATVEFGDRTLEDAGISIQLLLKPSGKSTGTATVVGTCTFVPAPDVNTPPALEVSIPRTQTAAANPGKYDLQVEAKWSDGETVTFLPYGKIEFVKDIRRQS